MLSEVAQEQHCIDSLVVRPGQYKIQHAAIAMDVREKGYFVHAPIIIPTIATAKSFPSFPLTPSSGVLYNHGSTHVYIGGTIVTETKRLTCSDGKILIYRCWTPENQNHHAVVHIYHGMAEHSERYDRFARYLNSLGIVVYAQDHRGHGLTATDDERGWFADSDGWMRVVEDGYELDREIVHTHPGKDVFLFGHSMGSLLVRTLICIHPELYRGVIVSGTSASKGLMGQVGRLLAVARAKKYGTRTPDALLDKLSFGAFAKKFEPRQTNFDWLSRDAVEVKKYIDDHFCGFICSSQFFVDLLDGIEFANNPANIAKVPKDMPMLIISGAMDVVGEFGKGVRKVHQAYRNALLTDLTFELVPEARHELLNEINREDIHVLLGKWLEAHKSRKNR